ncbi:LytR/AlgR family response regulator transcription factor [Cecembia calidifontis]|jgi:DNA-binding LytR/AlgR family response regulator|uniref:LytTR family two component transcriptional regulator n=1 Tax=Cecembia calidifontis TaxID=1187080 RepID=A0A4Q7P732_9BACT|nr:LytTR family DNA-binding domain-containing protein [Cecembia calidifontis]RZS95841.1 LytTR family two component transcriptional regulator [Cecembia calidifontis]
MKILLIEDEKPAASRLQKLISELLPEAQILSPLDSIQTAVDWFMQHQAPDLIFCDIQLADGLSFEIFEKVKVSSPIIFTTAYDQYAIKAFKLNSIDYLLKPIDPKELETSIQKFKRLQIKPMVDIQQLQELLQPKPKEYKSRFMVKIGEKILAIQASEASFFVSEERVTFLQTMAGKRFILDYTLDQLEALLDPKQFFRLSRKYIAAIESIAEIHTYSNSRLKIRLKDCSDNDILVSREKVMAMKEWLDGK